MMKYKVIVLAALCILLNCQSGENSSKHSPIYQSESFEIYKDKVVQGENIAEVVSPIHLKSNYRSPASTTFSRLVKFKFSINEKDNELAPGADHWLIIGDDQHESEVVTFGANPQPIPDQPNTYLSTNYEFTFKVDVSPVLKQFEEKGFYEAFNGTKVAKADFKGFYIAGGSEPLTWDFVNLDSQGLKLQPTDDKHIYSITVTLNPYNEAEAQDKAWNLSEDISNRPQYVSQQPIVDALFNLSLEEAIKNIEPDSTLRTGAKWGGVWTRDVSYSILLAFAYHEPEVAKISLRKKVRRGRIIQDTGSGGAWPVSSDRTTWCLAAWEIYKVTGDKDWLDEVYPIIKNTLEDDYKTIYDERFGLYSGESSFLDWREQTYPKWMDNRDIYVSHNLGTNVVHYQAHRILAEMAKLKGEDATIFNERADHIKKGINDHLWLQDQGYYAQFMYGREDLMLSPRYEALGEALAILFGVADAEKAASIISKSPLTEFGATCIYPQIPDIPPYHNNGIWPFVQSYWNWAAAKTGNEAVLNHGLASVYRAAGLFLTNYENMVAETGDFLGTEINSHRMLWSMAGNLAMVHRVFMGMEFTTDGLAFNPVIPSAYGGERSLSNFKYRDAILNITVSGHGTKIKSVMIDGKTVDKAFIASDASGTHEIVIEMANNDFPNKGINSVENHFTPTTVLAKKEGDFVTWQAIKEAKAYRIYKNGNFVKTTTDTAFKNDEEGYASYMISAVDEKGYEGFASEPVIFANDVLTIEAERFAAASTLPYSNFSGNGFVELTLNKNRELDFTFEVEKAGTYILDFKYANGSGRWNTNNKCAIRSLTVNNQYEGVVVMPQRGKDEWSDWGFSNVHQVQLKAGTNTVKVHFEDWNNNMNVDVNTAMLDYLRLIFIK
ncbi:MGH1-like glycoside hydrolase domain-containing protein [Winogradskyella sp.]|uniref:alpha-L-rhamnosidase-related protein n=1 Tax=Winogradskyella sp. TaxID=1883156 RepID=UPI003BAB87A1